MPWKGWDNPKTADDPFGRKGGFGRRFLFGERDVSNADIDKAIKQGKNPKNVFGRKIGKMSAADQRKVNARIRDRKHRAGQ